MKLFIKLMIAILVIGILLPFSLLKGKDGNPVFSFGDLKLPSISLPDAPKLSGAEDPWGGDNIYGWTDAEGNAQFSNSLPPEGVEYTVKGYDPSLNIIQAVEVLPDEPEKVVERESNKEISTAKDIGNPYSPEKIEKLFEDANNIERLLNQRLSDQEAVIGQ